MNTMTNIAESELKIEETLELLTVALVNAPGKVRSSITDAIMFLSRAQGRLRQVRQQCANQRDRETKLERVA